MLAAMSQQATTMTLPSQSPPKRPRLSLQIQSSPASSTLAKSPTSLKTDADPTSITAFNTLSNAYAAAIELSSPKVATLSPAVFDPKRVVGPAKKTSLRLVTSVGPVAKEPILFPSQRTQTPGPFTIVYPDTPSATFSAVSSPMTGRPDLRQTAANSFAFTPPQSAHPPDDPMAKVFSYASKVSALSSPISPRTPRRRLITDVRRQQAPYTHPRSLRSILRNSPLPPKSTAAPMSPTRSSRRIADRAAKKLAFNSPLTQTITTERYIKSHIDLLAEEASPFSPDPDSATIETLDLAMAYTGDETRDGGQTPGPFEDMRRRMAGLGSESNGERAGLRKRKRKEKKRQWVWTIGTNEDEDDEKPCFVSTPIAALELPQTPTGEMEEAEEADEAGETEEGTKKVDRIPPPARETKAPWITLTKAPLDQSEDTDMGG